MSPIDLSISMSMMTFLEEEDMKEETNWPTYSPTLSFPTFSPTLSNIPSNFPITSNPTVSPSFKPTDSPSESPQQPIEEVLPEELVLEEEEESSNECTGLAWRACKRNPLCDIISKNTECYLISDEGNNRRHLEVDRCTYRTQEKNCIRTVGCTWAGMRGCVNLDLLNHVVPPPLMLDTPRSDLVCPDTLTYLKEIDTSATLHYALVPSTTSSSGYLCARLEVRNHEGWVGIGISDDGKMKDSYAIIGIPNENTVQKYLLGGGKVTLSEEQTLKDASITQDDDGTMIMKFTKILVEEGDIPIRIDEDGENIFLHARGGDGLGYHPTRLAFALNLNGRNDTTVEEKEEANPTLPDIEDECSVIEKTKLCQKSEMCAWDDINLRCYIASTTQDTHEAEVVPIMTPSPTTVSPSLSPVSSVVDCTSIKTSRLCHKSEECTWNRNKDRCFPAPDDLEQSILTPSPTSASPSTSPVAFQCSSIKKIRVCRNAVECKWNGDKGKCFPAPIQDLEEASTSLSASPVTQKPTLYPTPATPEPNVMCADLKKQRLCRKQNYCTWDRQESNCFGTPPSVSPTSSPTPNPTREQVPTASPVSRSDIVPRIDGPCADLSMRLCIKKNGGICEWKREVGYGYCSPIETGTEDVRRLVNDQADQEWGRTISQSKQQYYRQMMSMPMQVAEMSMPEESYMTESFFEAVQVQDNDPESMRQLSQPSSADFHISEFAWEDEEEGSSRGEVSVDKRYMIVGLSASARASNLSMSIYYFTIIFGSVMWCVM